MNVTSKRTKGKFVFIYYYYYLTASGLSCSVQDLLVVAGKLLVAACGI